MCDGNKISDPAPATPPATSALTALDEWVGRNPWHPRVLPFVLYLLFLPLADLARGYSLASYPAIYLVQCTLVAYVLWRYRKLLPELTLSFHWLAVPIGLGLCAAWIGLGEMMIALAPERFGPDGEPHYFAQMQEQSAALYGLSLGLRLLGMSLLVPLFEELFIRSACLRGLYSPRKTGLALVQLVEDIPVVGEWVMETKVGRRAAQQPAMFTQQLAERPLGAVTLFGVAASTFVFMVHHVPRDWPGTIACGVAWCALVWWTNRPSRTRKLGLGPVVWSHGITNAALWAWCVWTGQWYWM